MVFPLFAIYTCNLVAAYIIPSVFFHFLKILHGEANLRYTTILCYTCDLVAAYIIPSVFFILSIFSRESQPEVHNDTLHVRFSRSLHNP